MKAILQVADSGPLESLVVMLRSIGIESFLPNKGLKDALRALNCDTVLDVDYLVKSWGYEKPFPLPEAGLEQLKRKDTLYIDVKAHRNGPKLWRAFPALKERTLWYRINGGKPEHVVNERGDHGDEVNPPCPVLTPNQWYADPKMWITTSGVKSSLPVPLSYNPRAYVCWPPFYRFDEYLDRHERKPTEPPLCLIHGIDGWGYRDLVGPMRDLGVRCCGVNAPDGLINHRDIPLRLSKALCMVHLKSSDAPGYALYEAMAAGCPIVCTRRLIWRCRMQELLIPGETCLVFDRETHEGLTPKDIEECLGEVSRHLIDLSDGEYNRRIGLAGRNRLREVMWDERRDSPSLRSFFERVFPCVSGLSAEGR